MSSEQLGSGVNILKGDLAASFDILSGSAADYQDLGIARRFGGAAAAYSLRDIGAMNGPVVKVRRDMDDPDGSTNDPEVDFSASQIDAGVLEDWVNGKLETTLPADVATARAAFSLRKVKDSYAEDAVRIRRSSDNAEVNVAFDSDDKVSTNSSISVVSGTVSDTTLGDFISGTDAFVHTWYDQTIDLTEVSTYYDTPFSASNFGVTNATEEYGTYLGRDNVVKITTIAGNGQKYHQKDFGIGAGESVRVTAEIYIPSSNTTIDSFAWNEKFNVTGNDRKQGRITPTQDQWVDIDFNYIQADDTSQRVLFWDSSTASPTANTDVTGDIIYFRNLIVTRVTKANQDAVQLTSANQPKIAESGTLLDYINLDGNTFLNIGANLMDGTDGTTSMVMSNIDIDVQTFYLSNRGGNNGFNFFNDTGGDKGKFKYAFVGSGASLTSNAFVLDDSNNKFLVTFTKDSNDREFFGNAAVLADDGASNTYTSAGATNTSIGKQGNSSTASTSKLMKVYEIVSYDTDETDNRFKIESNINNYYGLYNDANEASDVFQGVNYTVTDATKTGFTIDIVTATGVGTLPLVDAPDANETIYVSYNLTINSGSPSINVVTQNRSGSTITTSADFIITEAGFYAHAITPTQDGATHLSFADDADNVNFTISDLKISRIARNGFVETWYDQSGNGNNAVQGTATNQPAIVQNGSMVDGGLSFNGTNSHLDSESAFTLTATDDLSFFVVHKLDVIGTYSIIAQQNGTGTGRTWLSPRGGGSILTILGGSQKTFFGSGENTDQRLMSVIFDDSASTIDGFRDGVTGTQGTSVNIEAANGVLNIGESKSGGERYNGTMNEIIIYLSDLTSERTGIEADINNHYNIY